MNKNNKIISLPNYGVSSSFLEAFNRLQLTNNEIILIIYFHNLSIKEINLEKINELFSLKVEEIMNSITSLINKKLLTIDNIKDESNKIKEVVNLELFYQNVETMLNDNIKKTDDTEIFKKFEKEFGRPLSPTEYEIVNAWLDKNTPILLIEDALKEAVYNGVCNLRYIDKIIFEWTKKGYKSGEDVKKKEESKKEDDNLFDYNWLEDEE